MKAKALSLIYPLAELITPSDRGHSNAPGEIYLANEARFTSTNFSQALTAYSTGWTDQNNILKTLSFIAPEVPVNRRFEFKKATNSEEFLSETVEDIRAIGSPFKRVEYKGTTTNEKTLNKGLTIRLDKDEMLDGDEERAVMRLKTRLLRNDLRRAVTALAAIDNSGTAKVWGSTGKPDGDVLGAIVSAGDDSGVGPNRAIYGLGAWQIRYQSYEQQTTAGAFSALNQTPEQVAAKLGLSGGVYVSNERYQSAAAAKSKAVGDIVIVFYAEDGVGKDDPTVVKRFVTPVGDAGIRIYREEHDKYIDISAEHYSNIVTTSTVGAKKLTVSAS